MVEEWNRDFAPLRVCSCGHSDGEHDMTDSKGRAKKRQPCRTATGEMCTPCPCVSYDLTTFEWREHRVVVEVWKPPAA